MEGLTFASVGGMASTRSRNEKGNGVHGIECDVLITDGTECLAPAAMTVFCRGLGVSILLAMATVVRWSYGTYE